MLRCWVTLRRWIGPGAPACRCPLPSSCLNSPEAASPPPSTVSPPCLPTKPAALAPTLAAPPPGANGLASPRDFMTPVAWFEERECHFTVMHKFEGQLFAATQVGGAGGRTGCSSQSSVSSSTARRATAQPWPAPNPSADLTTQNPCPLPPDVLPVQRGGVARQLRALQVRPHALLPRQRGQLWCAEPRPHPLRALCPSAAGRRAGPGR